MTLPDDLEEIGARLTAIEFLLEVSLTNLLGNLHAIRAAAFISDVKRVGKRVTVPEGVTDLDAAMRIAVRSSERIAEILAGAAQRVDECNRSAATQPIEKESQ